VQIVIYDLLGKRIADVVNQNFSPGYHETEWRGTDNSGNRVSQGIYIYSIRTGKTDSEVRGKLVEIAIKVCHSTIRWPDKTRPLDFFRLLVIKVFA